MSGFFKTKKTKVERGFAQAPGFKDVQDKLADYYKGQIGRYGKEYTAPRVAEFTPRQKSAMERLDDFIYGRTGKYMTPTFNLASDRIKDILAPIVNPEQSLIYKSFVPAARKAAREAMLDIGDIAGGRGRFFSGARMAKQADVAENLAYKKQQLLADLLDRDINRKLQAIPIAVNTENIIRNLPAQEAETILRLAEPERQIEQQKLDTAYQDFIRRFEKYPLNITKLATSFAGIAPPRYYEDVTPGRQSPYSTFLQGMGTVNPSALLKGLNLGGTDGTSGKFSFKNLIPMAMSAIGQAIGGTPGAMIGNTVGNVIVGATSKKKGGMRNTGSGVTSYGIKVPNTYQPITMK